MMKTRKFGTLEISAVGLGCMGFTHGYGTCPSEEESIRLIRKAYDEGCTFFDTAEIYSCYPLAELNKRIFKSANRFVVNVVYILKDCKCTYFPEYSGKQSYCIFSIISHYHELIA